VVELRPAHAGFEKSLYVIYGLRNDDLADEKRLPRSMLHMTLRAELGDMSFLGMTGWVASLFTKVAARYARWIGDEERLLRKC
jgi:hypothetical protein